MFPTRRPANLISTTLEYLGTPGLKPDRTWILAPGQEIHLGFSKDVVESTTGTFELVGQFTATSLAFGLLSKIVSDTIDLDTSWWDYALIAACVTSTRVQEWDSPEDVATAFLHLARCAVEQPETILAVLRKVVAPEVWQAMSPKLFRFANATKKALGRYLVIAEGAYVLHDLTTTLSATRADRSVTLVKKTPATQIVTVVGVTKDGAPAPGMRVEDVGSSVSDCGDSNAGAVDGIVDCSPSAAGADICWRTADPTELLCGTSPWDKVLLRVTVFDSVPATRGNPDAAPWGLDLANGLRCRIRNDGSWGGRADGYVGAYYCDDSTNVVLANTDPLPDRSNPTWTVTVGPLGAPDETFPPPDVVAVVTAYFPGNP